MALIQRSATSVGVDTGVTHMSIALGRPTVALFGSTCPYLEVGSGLGEVLYEKLPCSPCRRHPTCNGAFTCMRELSVARVLATVRTYLEPIPVAC
jgi:heptosyltransferase-1